MKISPCWLMAAVGPQQALSAQRASRQHADQVCNFCIFGFWLPAFSYTSLGEDLDEVPIALAAFGCCNRHQVYRQAHDNGLL